MASWSDSVLPVWEYEEGGVSPVRLFYTVNDYDEIGFYIIKFMTKNRGK